MSGREQRPAARHARTVDGAAVRIRGLVHVYRVAGTDVAALRGVDLSVTAGERVALLGPSGSGKSTLLSVLAAIRRPSAGSILVDDRDLTTLSERQLHQYRSGGLGLMLQGARSGLLPYATAEQNVTFVAGRRGPGREVAREMLQAVGLQGDRRPAVRLSRAEQQAAALAVALAKQPRLLLVDEPTSDLGPAERDTLLDLVVASTVAAGATVIMVTHDEAVAGRMQRMIRMRDGRISAEGHRQQQYAVIGADGSVQLPEELLADWPAGSTVAVRAVPGPGILITPRPEDDDV